MADCQQCELLQKQLDNLIVMYKDKNKQIERLQKSKEAAVNNLKKKILQLVCKKVQDDN